MSKPADRNTQLMSLLMIAEELLNVPIQHIFKIGFEIDVLEPTEDLNDDRELLYEKIFVRAYEQGKINDLVEEIWIYHYEVNGNVK